MINITSKVEKGSVVLTCDGSKYELPGTEKTRYCNGKIESLSAEKSFEDLLSSVPSFNVKAAVDKDGNVTLKTPMSVEATGDRLGDVLDTVYSYDGKVLAKESKKLELPKEDIDGCLVKIKITWGKKVTEAILKITGLPQCIIPKDKHNIKMLTSGRFHFLFKLFQTTKRRI